MLARFDWAPALTRDGLERTDILAVHTKGDRPMVEVQVKSIRGSGDKASWPLSPHSQSPALHDREWFVLVAIPVDPLKPIRNFVVPRDHVAAAAWIEHMNWLTEPGIAAGKRNVSVTAPARSCRRSGATRTAGTCCSSLPTPHPFSCRTLPRLGPRRARRSSAGTSWQMSLSPTW